MKHFTVVGIRNLFLLTFMKLLYSHAASTLRDSNNAAYSPLATSPLLNRTMSSSYTSRRTRSGADTAMVTTQP